MATVDGIYKIDLCCVDRRSGWSMES